MKYSRYRKRFILVATLRTQVLKSWLKENNKTIDDFAKEIKVSSRSIKYWFKGRSVSKVNRIKVCNATRMFPRLLFEFRQK